MIEILAQDGPYYGWVERPGRPTMRVQEMHGKLPVSIDVPRPEEGCYYEGKGVGILHLHTEEGDEIVTIVPAEA